MVDYKIKQAQIKLRISRKKGLLKTKENYNSENTQSSLEDY